MNNLFKHLSFVLTLVVISSPACAGFWGSFFANVAADSISGKHSNRDPLLKEKKIQGALAVMGHYKGKADGDFNTFESRTAIKRFQVSNGLEETGILSEHEMSQLSYLSNLYASIQKKGVKQTTKNAMYDEIDSAIDSMRSKGLVEEYLGFLNPELHSLRVISTQEDADVFLNGEIVGQISLGHLAIKLESNSYSIKVQQFSEDGEWQYIGEKEAKLEQNTNIELASKKTATTKRLTRLKKEKADKEARLAKEKAQLKQLKTEFTGNPEQYLRLSKLHSRWGSFTDYDKTAATIIDPVTGLEWMRCSLGQVWDGNRCGKWPKGFWFSKAQKALKTANTNTQLGHSDWRLPTADELLSLVHCSSGKRENIVRDPIGNTVKVDGEWKNGKCIKPQGPTLNTSVFPNTPKTSFLSGFWTSTRLNKDKVAVVNFSEGHLSRLGKGNGNPYVRLVRKP